MTKRSAHQHRMLELKERVMAKVANKLFTRKTTGIDGLIKRQLLPAEKPRVKRSGAVEAAEAAEAKAP